MFEFFMGGAGYYSEWLACHSLNPLTITQTYNMAHRIIPEYRTRRTPISVVPKSNKQHLLWKKGKTETTMNIKEENLLR